MYDKFFNYDKHYNYYLVHKKFVPLKICDTIKCLLKGTQNPNTFDYYMEPEVRSKFVLPFLFVGPVKYYLNRFGNKDTIASRSPAATSDSFTITSAQSYNFMYRSKTNLRISNSKTSKHSKMNFKRN